MHPNLHLYQWLWIACILKSSSSLKICALSTEFFNTAIKLSIAHNHHIMIVFAEFVEIYPWGLKLSVYTNLIKIRHLRLAPFFLLILRYKARIKSSVRMTFMACYMYLFIRSANQINNIIGLWKLLINTYCIWGNQLSS